MNRQGGQINPIASRSKDGDDWHRRPPIPFRSRCRLRLGCEAVDEGRTAARDPEEVGLIF